MMRRGTFFVAVGIAVGTFRLVAADVANEVEGIRRRAAQRVEEIWRTRNPAVPAGARTYWISDRGGDDAADGSSPERAWRTIERLNAADVTPGSYVLFERGGTYRGSVTAKAGVTYAPYGTGPKPRVVCSPADGADPAKWRQTDAPGVWAYKIGRQDVGTIVFDDGAAHAVKVVIRTDAVTGQTFDKRSGRPFRSYRDLREDLTFWHDYYEKGTGELYLRSERNPGERFKSIEFNVKACCFRVRGPDVTIDGVEMRYAGVHGVAAGTCTNLTVRNCAFEWIGGSIQSEGIFGRDYPTRLGNGVEVYGGCENYTVSNCWFNQIYDAGVTHQFNVPEKAGARRFDQRHVRYVDNVFEKCNYSIEYFLTAPKGNGSRMEDIRFERNLMLDAGYGFCEERPDVDTAAHIKSWFRPDRSRARDYVVRDNVFCLSKDMLIEACAGLKDGDRSSLPVLEGNVFVGREGDCLGNVTMRDATRRPYDGGSEAFLNTLGKGNRCLVLPAEAPETVRVPDAPFPMPAFDVPRFPGRFFPITSFGARPGGPSCTEAFARAMAACEAAGGGHVFVPQGRWVTGPIRLRGNCDLRLADSAVVEFADDPSQYPVVDSSWEGVECRNLSPLVYAYGVTNVAITGGGLLAPRMDFWRTWFARTPGHMKATEHLYHWCSTNAPLAARDLTALPGSQVRPHLIQMNRVRGVLLDGFRIRESPFWTIHLYHSENCVVRHLNTFAHGHNNDGVDIEMTRNVLVEDCFFDQGDDGIVIKAGRNQDAWRLNRPTENVVVRNCEFVFAHSLLGIGSELSGGVRNIWMHHCKIGSSYNLLYVKTNRRRGGFVENIWIEDIDTESVRSALFGLKTDILYQWANFPDYELRYTRIAGINVRNVHARCADWAFDVTADEHLPARGLRFDNVTLDAARKGFSRIVNARDVKFRNVTMGDAEPTEWEQVVNETWHK